MDKPTPKDLMTELRAYLEEREQASLTAEHKAMDEFGERSPQEEAIQDTLYLITKFLDKFEGEL